MLVSSSPKESLCLGRLVRIWQKEPPRSASSWMTFHWYEAENFATVPMFYFQSQLSKCTVFFQTHLTFGKEFTEAVEMKQVAQQEAERARFVVEKVFFLMNNYVFHPPVHSGSVFVASPNAFYPFRQSNRSRQPSSQQRETPRLPCSLPTPWWRRVTVW